MEEEEFDALIQRRPFGTEDAKRADLLFRRSLSLGIILFGKTAEYLRRQIVAPFPEIPSGFELGDFRELLRTTEELSAAMSRLELVPKTIVVGTQRYTEWEAQCEIIRRAIDHLENH
ncbi:MAG TPA: hypothetical protein VK709_00315 [Candidatus Saccharimonadales bacterium]|jgi:hypothetical protein|nr:hypothetical protein [Candidatus Saccharimonadales bacterium]